MPVTSNVGCLVEIDIHWRPFPFPAWVVLLGLGIVVLFIAYVCQRGKRT